MGELSEEHHTPKKMSTPGAVSTEGLLLSLPCYLVDRTLTDPEEVRR